MASISCIRQTVPLIWIHQRRVRCYQASLSLLSLITAPLRELFSKSRCCVMWRAWLSKENWPNTDGLNYFHLLSLKQPWWPVSLFWWEGDHGAPDIRTSRRRQCICFISRALIVPTAVLLPGSVIEHRHLRWVPNSRALSKTIRTSRSDVATPP